MGGGYGRFTLCFACGLNLRDNCTGAGVMNGQGAIALNPLAIDIEVGFHIHNASIRFGG